MIRAGAASIDITPPLGLTVQAATHSRRAVSIRDPLEANAVFIAGQDTGIVLVTWGSPPNRASYTASSGSTSSGAVPRR